MSVIHILRTFSACVALAAIVPVTTAMAQAVDGSEQPAAPNVPAPGEPRAKEQLPEAPPEEMLKSAPPIEKKAPEPADAAKPNPPALPTLPPAKKIEPKVPNT